MKKSMIKRNPKLAMVFLTFGIFQLYRFYKLTPGALKEIRKIGE